VESLRVLLAVSDPGTRKTIRELLIHNGYSVCGEAHNASEALRISRSQSPGLVIMDTELEGGRVGQVAMILEEDGVAPVLILASSADPWIKDFSYMLKPVTATNLIPAIESTFTSYQKRSRLLKEVARLQNQLATRQVVAIAKGILMQEQGMSEEQAHRFLQKTSMDRGLPLKSVAEAVIALSKTSGKGESE